MSADRWREAVGVVMDIHQPHRIYEPCGHDHTAEDDDELNVVDVDDVGVVCEKGYQYSICIECCTDADDNQTEACVSEHVHTKQDSVFCRTVLAVAKALNVPGSLGGVDA